MPDTTIEPGRKKTVLSRISRAAATVASFVFWLRKGGHNGIIITLQVDSVGAAGSVDTITLQSKDGDVYSTVVQFAGLGIVATGIYRFLVSPGADSTGGYTAVADLVPPAYGRVSVVHSANAMTYGCKVEAL